ncbi:23631_t:CDS:2 [Cetraspora pellucida]|uniref:23631_t:CDS:1 n=1 Tax=Cetraspora pellucida TaxID=1433469 RepID=A0A9N9I941_9GLOM|nr:23631_t:CDS:2 [Cetraspora pellucida]
MAIYKEEKIELIPPVLGIDERELIFVTQNNKNEESYWTIKHLLKQIKENTIPIFEAKFLDATAVFAFDNNDTLIVQKINKGFRRKQSIMRLTTFIDINSQVKVQEIVFEQNYFDSNMRGKPKEIKHVLEERELLKDRLNLDCLMCKQKMNSDQINCCLRKIIVSQPDFVAQKFAIVELIEDAGHICIFYLKFHYELNFIEMY